jgi:hypothetical protein
MNKDTGARVCGYDTRWNLSFSLGQYTTVFQVELYAIKACVAENLGSNYRNRNISILSVKLQLKILAKTISKQRTQEVSLSAHKQARALIQGPSANETKELLKLNRNHMQWVVGLLTGL